MPVKDSKTEQLLKDAAKTTFFKEGRMMATTQEIADAAGINRSLLHYYFRSRDVLFDTVFREALMELRTSLHGAIGANLPFRKKVELLVQTFLEELTQWPYLETFVTLQLNQHPDRYTEFFVQLPGGKERLEKFLEEIRSEMKKGTIPEMHPVQYFMNLFALITYPYVARPVLKNLFEMTGESYNDLLCQRKQIILSLVFK